MRHHSDEPFRKAVIALCEEIRDLKAEVEYLWAMNKRLQFMADNGLCESDMR